MSDFTFLWSIVGVFGGIILLETLCCFAALWMEDDKVSGDQPSLFDFDLSPKSDTSAGSRCQPADVARESFWDKHVQPAIDRAEQNADPDWRDVARDCLFTLAETRDVLTADDLLEMLEPLNVETHNLSALGPIFLRASRSGWIENTGRMVRSRIARRHRKITVWESRLRGCYVAE